MSDTKNESKFPPHDIRHDPTGTGRDRWSCYANRPGCEGRAVVHQPFMSAARWEQEVAEFKAAHS